LRDESGFVDEETYIGAMPGRIIQSLKKAGTSNPVLFWMKLINYPTAIKAIPLRLY
jgi:ATP-dependent Lon protease